MTRFHAALFDLYGQTQQHVERRAWGWIVTPVETPRLTVVYRPVSVERPKIVRLEMEEADDAAA